MRICLVSPRHLSTNPRLVKEARALRAAGHDVHVIHGRFMRWGTENDAILARDCGEVSAVRFGPTEASKAAYLRQTIIRRGAEALVRAGLPILGLIEAAHAPAMDELAARTATVRADLYIAHYVAALPAAARAAGMHNAAYAFDAEDFHLGDLPERPEHGFEKSIIRAIEARYLPGATFVTAASPLIAAEYAKTYGIRTPNVVLNCFPRTNGPASPSTQGQARPGPSVYWFSQTIGPGRGLEAAIEAIGRAKSLPHLYLRGAFADRYKDLLLARAQSGGVADRLHFLELAPPDTLERLGATYDVGYVCELAESRNRQIALTNKILSYLLSGIPAVASDIPSHRLLSPELGPAITLFPANDPEALANALDSYLMNPTSLATARHHAWKLGQNRYNWETEQSKLIELIAGLHLPLSRTSAPHRDTKAASH